MPDDPNLLWSAAIGAGAALVTKLLEQFVSTVFEKWNGKAKRREDDLAVFERVAFEVRDLAKIYWIDPKHDPSTSGAIVGRLSFASSIASTVFAGATTLSREVDVAINRFDQACTAGSFGSATRTAEPDRCTRIEETAYSLVHTVRVASRRL